MPELPEFADLIQNRYNRESGAVNPVMPGRVRNSGKLALSYNLYCFGGCEALPVGSDEEKGGGGGGGAGRQGSGSVPQHTPSHQDAWMEPRKT